MKYFTLYKILFFLLDFSFKSFIFTLFAKLFEKKHAVHIERMNKNKKKIIIKAI